MRSPAARLGVVHVQAQEPLVPTMFETPLLRNAILQHQSMEAIDRRCVGVFSASAAALAMLSASSLRQRRLQGRWLPLGPALRVGLQRCASAATPSDDYGTSVVQDDLVVVDEASDMEEDDVAQRQLDQGEESNALAAQDPILSKRPSEIVPLDDASMGDFPEVKYASDKKQLAIAYARGDIHLMEASCDSLLERQPDDLDVWRTLTISRLRLKLWDAALIAARRWIAFDPCAVGPRNAEAIALAGCGQFGEARARLEFLADELVGLDADLARDLREAVWRIDELWIAATDDEPDVCQLSARVATVITGERPPHFFLPNFADSIGPVRVVSAQSDEAGGGQAHGTKLVVTRNVEAGDLLFVQAPMVFGKVTQKEHLERLGASLLTVATTSARGAACVEMLANDGLHEDDDPVEFISNRRAVRGGPWKKDPKELTKRMMTCGKVLERCYMNTGRHYVGVWTLPGMARHSCCPTANAVCFGDVMVARTARTLQAGDEVTFAFSDIQQPLDVRRTSSMEHRDGFWCNCKRCQAEETIDSRLQEASDELRECFDRNHSRIKAIKEDLCLQFEFKRQDMEKGKKFFTHNSDRNFHANLLGLADRWKEENDFDLSEENLAKVRKRMPKQKNKIRVDLPQDLLDQLIPSIKNFEQTLDSCNVDEQLRNWIVMSHWQPYCQLLVLMLISRDVNSQRWLTKRMQDAVAETAPGSYWHATKCLARWEFAVKDSASINPDREEEEAGLSEKEELFNCLKLRYGSDLSPVEMEAAVNRLRCSQDVDENWFPGWLSSCIGVPPRDESKNPQAFGDDII